MVKETAVAIVIGGAAVFVRDPSDAMVALTHGENLTAQLLDEDGALLRETEDPDVVMAWPREHA